MLARPQPRYRRRRQAAAQAADRVSTEGIDRLPSASSPLLDITGGTARRLDRPALRLLKPSLPTWSFVHLDHPVPPCRSATPTAPSRSAPISRRALRVGLGGPVGSGKTATVAALCRTLRRPLGPSPSSPTTSTPARTPNTCGAKAVLPPERISRVETGACPHTAIRDDISANLEAVEHLEAALHPLDLVLIETGGDNLTATFSKGLVDVQIFVIDVASGDDIPARAAPASPPPTSSSSTRPTSPRMSAQTWTPWPATRNDNAATSPSSSPASPPTTASAKSPTGSPATSANGTPGQPHEPLLAN